jgi:hypothetical protein
VEARFSPSPCRQGRVGSNRLMISRDTAAHAKAMPHFQIGIFLICTIMAFGLSSDAQSGQKNGKASVASTAVLAKPSDWGSSAFRLFRKDPRQVTFKLATSWIPGEGHKGMLRYKLTAFQPPTESSANDDDSNTTEAVEKLMNRVQGCSIFLELYDNGGFILRKHEVPFGFGVNGKAHVVSLYANDSFQMDAEEYRQWISEKAGGSWSIAWDCGPTDPNE